ncbi:GNAT family N-acetyltransferase [Actinoplanes couchii]|uniref:GNAT family N-acetyltransferase n=1 Tax=Actinoplanes couchii TaxID=403638 RepID=UPI001EF1D3FA|nr:GNAT family N-acetyltransferase [Actinoplanes couchii]MDR6326392.1 ribosomal protein S18 acetylase RimI-like enzyme [Actinoplanes couchii]
MSHLRTRPKALEIGPFVAGLDPDTESPFINYASPVPGAPITAADVAALVTAFTEAGRKPRLEYVTSCTLELEALLLGAGFTVEVRNQYLICTPSTLGTPPVPADFDLREPETDRDRAAVITAQNEAFGDFSGDPSEDAVARMRRHQENGGVTLGARTRDGVWAGGGQAVPPNDGLSEVAGIAVREAFRRRGLGGAITAGITRRLFDRGAEVAWLEASGDDSWRVYERIGFVPSGYRLYISRD